VPTLGEHVNYWHENIIRPNGAPLTYQTYGTYIRLHILPGVGGKRLDRLEVRDVQLWINKVARTCQCCAQGKDANRREDKRRCCAKGKCCEQRLAPRTIRDIRDVLRAALSHAQLEGLISRNPTAGVKLPKIRNHKRKAWSSDEARVFLESARTDKDPMYPLYSCSAYRGSSCTGRSRPKDRRPPCRSPTSAQPHSSSARATRPKPRARPAQPGKDRASKSQPILGRSVREGRGSEDHDPRCPAHLRQLAG